MVTELARFSFRIDRDSDYCCRIASPLLQIFTRRSEAVDLVESLAKFLRLDVVESEAGRLNRVEPEDLRGRPADRPLRVYLSNGRPTKFSLEAHPLQPGRWGWLQVDMPIELPDTLLLGAIAAKSDWNDARTGLRIKNEAAIDLYNRVSKVIRTALQGPMWVRNVKTGAVGPYRNLRYSEGARDWLARGGKLRQEGVANNEFLVSDPARLKVTNSKR